MERIGYFFKSQFRIEEGLNEHENLTAQLHFGERQEVEAMDDVVQPVCAGLLLTKTGKIFRIQKTDKCAGKSAEKGKTLFYVGGHLDEIDKTDELMLTFANGMKREISEELLGGKPLTAGLVKSPFIVYRPDNAKSAKHFGVIFPVIFDEEFVPKFAKGEMKEKKSGFVSIEEVTRFTNLESWSATVLPEVLKNFNTYIENE